MNLYENKSFSTKSTNVKIKFKDKLKQKLKESRKKIIINNKPYEKSNINPNNFVINFHDYDCVIIKSYSEDDIHKSIKYGIWSSTKEGNNFLNKLFSNGLVYSNEKNIIEIKKPVLLFFSVNKSKLFNGMAIMKSKVNFNMIFKNWFSKKSWSGLFRVKWIFIKDLYNYKLKNILNIYNENKKIYICRDCTKISKENTIDLINEFNKLKVFTSILDDFSYYNKREKIFK